MFSHVSMPGCALTARFGKSTFSKMFGLYPDGYEDADSGWPRVLRRFADEAWRRAEAGELDDAELYTSDAQWSGLCDQIKNPTPDESSRRRELAKLSLECAHG
jgi:hypothetical protein